MSDPRSDGVPCMWMRGGTSKGGYFLSSDLPPNTIARHAFLLGAMGSPDPRQIDGMGGADPLTSKVAVVSPSARPGVDADYLFLQVGVDTPFVTDAQNCGNILAGVAPFAIERGLLPARDGKTPVTIFMENTGRTAVVTVQTPGGRVSYSGDSRIDGVPGTASPVMIAFKNAAGSTCGALLPTGNSIDVIDGVEVTMIDNGMPCVVARADALGVSGRESRETLEANETLGARLEAIRLQCGPAMNLGDVSDKTVPKMTMVSAPASGGAVSTRTFIPHRCHASIGVLGAMSVATACLLEGSSAAKLANIPAGNPKELQIEHPSGQTTVVARLDRDGTILGADILRTARKLFDGRVFAA